MNNGIFGEGFPYSNFHDLNMDWIIKIAKDFLDQYTHIEELIENGIISLNETTENGLAELEAKRDDLLNLLQEWYNEHSEDIADELADALQSLNDWYTQHMNDIITDLNNAILAFNTTASQKAAETIESIPADYTELSDSVVNLKKSLIPYNTFNVLDLLFTAQNSTETGGATFAWNGHDCTVTGTTTAICISNIVPHDTPLPAGLVPGKAYKVTVSTTNTNITLNIFFKNSANQGTYNTITSDGYIYVPSDAVTWGARLYIAGGLNANGTVTRIGLFIDNPDEFCRKNRNSYGTDLNNYKYSGYYGLDSDTQYVHCPVIGSGGVLIVYNYYNTVYVSQMIIRYATANYIAEAYVRSGKTDTNNWSKWARVDVIDNDFIPVDKLWTDPNVITTTVTSNGMTFTKDATKQEVELDGTWNGQSTCFANLLAYPGVSHTPFTAGESYYMSFDCPDPYCELELFYKNSSNVETKYGSFNHSFIYNVPSVAVDSLLRIRYNNSNVLISDLKANVTIYKLPNILTKNIIGATDFKAINTQKIAMFGDSVMSGTIKTPYSLQTHCVAEYVQDELKIKVADGTIGSIGYITHVYLNYNILELVKSVDLSGCNYFVCCAGDNDSGYPIGTYTDTNNGYSDYEPSDRGATIMGNIYKLVNYLHTTYNNITVILCTKPNAINSGSFPTYRRGTNQRIYQLNEEIRKFCKYYGCGLIDFDNAGFDGWILPQILESDGVHFNYKGYEKLSLFLAKQLENFTGKGNYYDNVTDTLTYSP